MGAEQGLLYRQIATRIEKMIDDGVLRPGEKVPSVRKMSTQEDVSVSTVLQAYLHLENKGFIEARPQSGYYVRPRVEATEMPSLLKPRCAPTKINCGDFITSMLEASTDRSIVPLGAACPSRDLYPSASLNRTLSAMARKMGHDTNAYEFPPGNIELRRQIARRSVEIGQSISPDDIIVTSGATEALNLAIRAVAKPGELVAIESPTYYGVLQILEHLGIRAIEIPTCPREGMSVEALAEALQKNPIKAVIAIPTLHNPLGACMPEARKKELVTLLTRHDVPLIEDDLNGELHYGDRRPKPAAAYDKKGLVILCSSFSKTLSPGFRVGWIVPGRYFSAIKKLKLMTTLATATLPQAAIAEYLHSGGYDKHLRRLRRSFEDQMDSVKQAVCRYFPEGTKVNRPSGGFVLWVELPKSVNSLELYEKAIASGVSVAPGPIFSAKSEYKNYIRLNCGNHWSESIDRGLIFLGRLAQ